MKDSVKVSMGRSNGHQLCLGFAWVRWRGRVRDGRLKKNKRK
jgi:hypothetical protein